MSAVLSALLGSEITHGSAPLSLTSTPSASTQVGVSYSQTNVASGGTSPYTYSVLSGTLPAGTTLNTTTGTVSGTPTTAGAVSYTIKVADSVPATASQPSSGTIAPVTLTLTSTPSSLTQVSQSYSQTNVASGGTSPYTYSVSAGTLPTSTSLNTSTGTVSGTPTVSGAFSYAITVTDNVSATAAQTSSGTMAASGYSAAATQFFARITDPGTTRKNLYAALIDGLVTDGVWSLLDDLLILAADSSANALVNLVSSSYTASLVNGGTPLTFTANHGFNNGGATSNASYIETNYNPSTAGVNYTQNSAHYSAWTQTSSTDGTSGLYLAACYNGTTWEGGILPILTGAGGLIIRCNGGTDTNWANANHQGHYIAVRPTSSTRTGYKNGSSLGSFSASTSAALVNKTFALLWNEVTGSTYNNIDQISVFSAGASLTSTQALALYNRLSTYIVAVSPLSLTATASSSTQVGVAYSQTNVASGGTSPYVYSVSAGSLPTSTTLNTSTGTVSGTPTVSGAFSYAITVTDNVSATAAQTSSGTIAAGATLSLAATPSTSTQVGVSYLQTNVASGGTTPYVYSVSAGSLPTSTSLNTTTGAVSGTPTVSGAFSYAITVTDHVSATAAQTSSGTIAASSGVSPPSFATAFGFTNVALFDDFNSISTLDTGATYAPGFNWYPGFGAGVGGMNNVSVASSILTFTCPAGEQNYLWSAAGINGFGSGHHNKGSVGKAFSSRDGFYMEARTKFNPADSPGVSQSCYTFWSTDFLNWALVRTADPSWPAIAHSYCELDSQENPFYQTLHVYPAGAGYVDDAFGSGASYALDFTQWHTWGVMVVPSTKNSGTGLMRFYVDRVQKGTDVTWTLGTLDDAIEWSHEFLICTCGDDNVATTMQVDYIGLWNSGAGWDGPTTNLTHRWPMRDTQVVGTSVKDVVGTLHGTAGSGISSTAGPLCIQARAGNGTTAQGYITLPSAPIANLSTAWSIAGWVNMTNISASGGSGANLCICQLDDGTRQIRFVVDHTTHPGALCAINQAGTSLFATAAALFASTYYVHFTVTFDGTSTYTVYNNGISASLGGTAVTGTPTTGSCFMASSASAADSYAGAMSQFTTYTKALSALEVAQLYNSYDP